MDSRGSGFSAKNACVPRSVPDPDQDQDPLVRGLDADPSIIKQK
jgi:hypothetical protein